MDSIDDLWSQDAEKLSKLKVHTFYKASIESMILDQLQQQFLFANQYPFAHHSLNL